MADATEECVVDIKFCNDDTERVVYEDTRYGKIQARDRYWELVHLAHQNHSILNKAPHIAWLCLTLPVVNPDEDNSVQENFPCPCTDKERANA